jgi:hypothetical protein
MKQVKIKQIAVIIGSIFKKTKYEANSLAVLGICRIRQACGFDDVSVWLG